MVAVRRRRLATSAFPLSLFVIGASLDGVLSSRRRRPALGRPVITPLMLALMSSCRHAANTP